MGNPRGIGNGGPVRLMSPAPMVLNPAAGSGAMRIMSNQSQQQQQQPSLYNTQHQSLYSSAAAGSQGSQGVAGSLGSFSLFSRYVGALDLLYISVSFLISHLFDFELVIYYNCSFI